AVPRRWVSHDPMLGRPAWAEPVLINSFAGAWLKTLVAIERTTATSSTIDGKCGRHSETQVPALPYFLNLRRVPSSLGTCLAKVSMKAKRLPLMNSAGIGLPCSSLSLGL